LAARRAGRRLTMEPSLWRALVIATAQVRPGIWRGAPVHFRAPNTPSAPADELPIRRGPGSSPTGAGRRAPPWPRPVTGA